MSIYRRDDYILTPEAHEHLVDLFSNVRSNPMYPKRKSRSSIVAESRQRTQERMLFDGINVQTLSTLPNSLTYSNTKQGMSHGLNLIAQFYDPDDLIDNRTPLQLSHCQREENPPTFRTREEANEYYELNQQRPTYKALWSNSQLEEFSDIDDESDDIQEPVLEPTRRLYHLFLSPGAISFYYHLAFHYKMQPPVLHPRALRKPRIGRLNYVSAALEAIGCQWLLLPDDYQEVLSDNPNTNKVRTDRKPPTSHNFTQHGNHAHTPLLIDLKDSRWQPFTHERMLELRAEMIKNGEIPSE